MTLCKHVPCNTLKHSTNEDLLNIKRKCDPEVSYPLSETRNPRVIKVILLACFTYIDIFEFIKSLLTYWQEFLFLRGSYFWDFVRNDNSNKGTTALDSALKKVVPNISRPQKSRHFLMHWMSVKLPDNFPMREHSWPCRFHISHFDNNNIKKIKRR